MHKPSADEGTLRRVADRFSLPFELFEFLVAALEKGDEIMAAIDDLNAAVSDLQTQVTAENDALASVASQLQAASTQLAELQSQVAATGNVSADDLEALATTITGVAKSASDAVASTQPAAPVSPSDPSAPSDPGVDPSAGGTPADPTSGAGSVSDPGAVPADPAAPSDPTAGTSADPSAGSTPDVPGGTTDPSAVTSGSSEPVQAVYTFDGDPSTVDTTVWPASGFETTDTPPRPLFYYSGDNGAGAGVANGDGVANAWHVYTGSVQPAQVSSGDVAEG